MENRKCDSITRLVRCKDCIFAGEGFGDGLVRCLIMEADKLLDDFCSDGEGHGFEKECIMDKEEALRRAKQELFAYTSKVEEQGMTYWQPIVEFWDIVVKSLEAYDGMEDRKS